ncbi:bifunctional [glutamate--ammonia ligase]-adenylyl-L-tyrosine phosphorylase/[glutamate--ammonia-ligase] adenylyltransferase [Chitinasiproducens palmae]|uniref:Bifunctional glutamine synthetase adenylyltransferase/adenylyl-removing enzyme n=1 Tax=Chitinasiproducens palmae TaxID=1770053 RepID=A0A1H2PTA3_9BURK|nr:bifunctional [glutamate--ammonia ligase]-adenylyl-L-tyrosine phosphorylase/[glutamate--ammonia-ligase] adenylyltransferase [Chitinasiproducens palmae]SDV49467.1 glutamate-ammonia-ligase adenylyltransferase [Chitinasiproducens palmae]
MTEQHAAGPAPWSTAYSAYARRQYIADPALAERVAAASAAPWSRQAIAARCQALLDQAAGGDADEALRRALRRLRTEVFLVVMERDLSGAADLGEVTVAMTWLAEVAIETALARLEAELGATFGAPLAESDAAPLTLGVVGMGKLGGGELNVSSDIDLIFVYDEDGMTAGGTRRAIDNHDYFTRLARRLIGALAEHTADGYVFRVDTRLRPNGDSGPLVCSLAMLEEYFYVQGREWERYAWIKGRLVSEVSSAAGARLARNLGKVAGPFVYRRYLDYGAIDAIRALHAQIRQEAVRRANLRPDVADDVKLGRGGIREIEFSAQVLQLIRGGQDAGLRARPTLAVLAAARDRGLIGAEDMQVLADAYHFLRRVEHRLQYVEDAQTHAVPVDEAARERLAQAMSFADFGSFAAVLQQWRDRVERHFDATFSDKREAEAVAPADGAPGAAGDSDAATALATALWHQDLDEGNGDAQPETRLQALGYAQGGALVDRLRDSRAGRRYQALGGRARERFDALMVRALVQVASEAPPAARDATLTRFIDLLAAIGGRTAYLSLLTEFPAALARVLQVLGASSWGANYLVRHPQLLDELLDDESLTPCDPAAFQAGLRQRLARADGAEQQMDLLRHAHQAEVFRVLLRDLRGRVSVEAVGDELSALADAVLDVVVDVVWASLPKRHRDRPGFAIVAYGKLGGKELGYASDLDIIFLYDDPHPDAPDIYARFARRLVTWMTTATGAGVLFDIDLRLRPNGMAGLLVTDLEAFRTYQLREDGANVAWVWEHQAITRARFSAGDPLIGAAFEEVRRAVLGRTRDPSRLAGEIVAMREKVLAGHPNPSEEFDLKHDRGGMVDIEFIVQYLVLREAHARPALYANAGNIALLARLAEAGVVSPPLAAQVADAYRDYRARQHALRLDGRAARVPYARIASQAEAVRRLWQDVFGPERPATAG